MTRRSVFALCVLAATVLLLVGGPSPGLACSVTPFAECPEGCACTEEQETRTCTNSGCPSSTSCGSGHSSNQVWCGTSPDGRNEYYKTTCSLTGTDYSCDACLEGYFGGDCQLCTSTCGGPDAGECDDGMDGDGGCSCFSGYAGDECQYSDADTCKGHGAAQDDGSCVCEEGYTGKDCSKKADAGISRS